MRPRSVPLSLLLCVLLFGTTALGTAAMAADGGVHLHARSNPALPGGHPADTTSLVDSTHSGAHADACDEDCSPELTAPGRRGAPELIVLAATLLDSGSRPERRPELLDTVP